VCRVLHDVAQASTARSLQPIHTVSRKPDTANIKAAFNNAEAVTLLGAPRKTGLHNDILNLLKGYVIVRTSVVINLC